MGTGEETALATLEVRLYPLQWTDGGRWSLGRLWTCHVSCSNFAESRNPLQDSRAVWCSGVDGAVYNCGFAFLTKINSHLVWWDP